MLFRSRRSGWHIAYELVRRSFQAIEICGCKRDVKSSDTKPDGLSSDGAVMGAGYSMIATIQGDNFLSSLGRYEAGLRRQYFRCLHTMHGLRKSGKFPVLPPPVLLEAESEPPNPKPGATAEVFHKPATVEDTSGDPAPAENPDLVTKVPSSES